MSTLNVANVTDGTTSVPTGYVVNGSAKVWCNFNGSGTVSIRDSLNSSSITDYGTGNYSVNISNNMGNVNYSISGATSYISGLTHMVHFIADGADEPQGVGSLSGETRRTDTNAYVDLTHIHLQAHGDLA